jgi:putative protease
MSAVIGSRSANRGLCAQACRLPCSAVKGKERYDLSLKDMSYIDKINDIESAGVYSFKIEGRMKRPEYVAATVDGLKKSLSGEDYDRQLLEDVFSRNGFTDGYLTGNLGRNMFGVRTAESAAMATKAFPKIHEIYRHDEKRDKVFFDLEIKADKPVKLTATDSHGNTAEVYGDIPQTAKSKAADSQTAEKQLSKTGDTIYSFGGLDCQIDEGLFVSPSQLNGLRREVCHRLDCARAESFTKKVDFHRENLTDFQTVPQTENQILRISVTSLSQLAETDLDDIELCAVPLEIFSQAAKLYPVEKLMISMPRFTFDEVAQEKLLEQAKAAGAKHILGSNIGHVTTAERFGMKLHADFGFNITNSVALSCLKKLGAADATASFELKASQIRTLKKAVPTGIFAYGYLPLMLTANCPVSQAVGCKNCTGKLIDRTNREFPVKCPKKPGLKSRDCVEIMNSEVLYLADRLDDFKSADFLMLNFFDETAEQVSEIIHDYTQRTDNSKPLTLTRGLYYRGVK